MCPTFGEQYIFIIPHPHFIGIYPDAVTREQARAALDVPPAAFAYGFFGGIQPYKGVEGLIESFQRLPGDDTWLLISGGNARQPDFLDAIRRRTERHPRIVLRAYDRAPNEDIALIMRAADVITLPFVDTMTSGSLILALSWGKPVIAPALGCLPTTVQPAAGKLYDPSDDDPLYAAMQEAREFDLGAASQAALASVRQLDWDEIAAATLRAYEA